MSDVKISCHLGNDPKKVRIIDFTFSRAEPVGLPTKFECYTCGDEAKLWSNEPDADCHGVVVIEDNGKYTGIVHLCQRCFYNPDEASDKIIDNAGAGKPIEVPGLGLFNEVNGQLVRTTRPPCED